MSAQDAASEAATRVAPSGNGPASASGRAENVERIRDILFGPQMREYRQRLVQIEERFLHEAEELKGEVRRRLDSLEAYTHQEVNELAERLKAERSERAESASQLARALADSVKSLEQRWMQSDERSSKDLRELRQLTFDRLKSLLDDVTLRISTLEGLQHRHIEDLRATTIDRYELASLLTEVAMRIRGEFAGPDSVEVPDAGANP